MLCIHTCVVQPVKAQSDVIGIQQRSLHSLLSFQIWYHNNPIPASGITWKLAKNGRLMISKNVLPLKVFLTNGGWRIGSLTSSILIGVN